MTSFLKNKVARRREVDVTVAGYIVLTFKFEKVDRRWTAYCEELGTATFGRSLPEAERKLRELVLLHLNTLEEVGERARFFQEHNIRLHRTKPSEDVTVCLPIKRQTFIESYIQPIRELSPA